MKHVPLSTLESVVIKPGFEKVLKPLVMYRGTLSLGQAHRMWNLIVSGMEHEADLGDLLDTLPLNQRFSHLCCPDKKKSRMALYGFLSRLRDNPLVMAEMSGVASYVAWLGGHRFRLTPVSEVTHRRRSMGAGGWRTFVDDRAVARPVPPEFRAIAAKKSNQALMRRFGASIYHVGAWRRETGIIAPNERPLANPTIVYPFAIHDGGKPEHVLLRKVNAAVPKYLDPDLRADICQDLIVGILCGDFDENTLTLPAKEMTRRVQRMFADKYGSMSLDQMIDDRGTTMMDTLTEEDSLWANL